VTIQGPSPEKGAKGEKIFREALLHPKGSEEMEGEWEGPKGPK